MQARALVLALILLYFSGTNAEDEWSEEQLKQSKQWKDDQAPLILTKSGSLPDRFLKALVKAIGGSNVTHFKVICQGLSGDEDVCKSLTKYSVTVRKGGKVEGVDINYDSESAFASAVLESLLSSYITRLWSYSELTKYSIQHPQHLLTVTPNNEDYAALLSVMLMWPLPLGVAMSTGVLPLSQRGQYSQPPSLLRLWYIVQGKHWYSNQDMTGFNLQVVQRCKTSSQLIREFVERVYHPVVTHYQDDKTLVTQFAGSGLHMAIVFPGLSGTDPESVAVRVAQDTFMNYAFVIMPDRSRLRRFVIDTSPSLHIIVLPYGHKTDLLRFQVEGKDLIREVRHITYTLRAYAVENPWSKEGPEIYANLGPSITEVSEIKKTVIATRKHHLFAYFCLQESRRCMQVGYKVVREVLSVVRVTDLGRSLAAHVVVYKSANTKPFKLKNLITCAIYNSTTKAWTVATENISSGSGALQFISKLTGMNELAEVARAMIHATLTLAEVPPPPEPLQEDDPFNLVAVSFPDPTIPAEIQLTSNNFHQHIAKFSKTAIVFCVRWNIRCKVFLHQTVTAHTHLQLINVLNVSLAVVSCDNDTHLCSHYQVTSYPTVLLFSPSTIDNPIPLNGTLDSTQLLTALDQTEDRYGSLAELTPKSLPTLLAGGAGIDSTLVLWCNEDVSSDMAATFKQQAFHNPYADFIFAWINSTNHSHLLSHIVPAIADFPVVIALSFKQHYVHLLAVEQSRETFESKLSSFLKDLKLGTLDASGYVADKVWLPLQPPIPFPSTEYTKHSNRKSNMGYKSQSPQSDKALPSNAQTRHHSHTEL